MQTPLDNDEYERHEARRELQESLMDKLMKFGFYWFFVFPGAVMVLYVAYQLLFN